MPNTRTLNDLESTQLNRLNESALRYFLNTTTITRPGFLIAVQLTQKKRRQLHLSSEEGLRFWQCWIEGIETWSRKFPPHVLSDVRSEPRHQHSSMVRCIFQVCLYSHFWLAVCHTATFGLRFNDD
jgi:hypothetical protein